jgi:hypothetical protein
LQYAIVRLIRALCMAVSQKNTQLTNHEIAGFISKARMLAPQSVEQLCDILPNISGAR